MIRGSVFWIVAVDPEKTAILGFEGSRVSAIFFPARGRFPAARLVHLIGNLDRARALPISLVDRIVSPLEKRSGFLGAHDDRHRALLSALFHVNLPGTDEIHISGSDAKLSGLTH